MLGSFRNRRAGVFVWVLLVLLFIGLAGFGIRAGGGIGTGDVARVGDERVTGDELVSALQQELRALNQQVGRSLPMSEARQYGIDRMVLTRLVNDAALDEEAGRLGLSTGDEAVRAAVMAAPAFRGANGQFDREAYEYALQNVGLRPSEFEQIIRREQARALLTAGVEGPATLPDSAALTILNFLGEKRNFDWIRLDAALLPAPIPAPTDADLQAFHDARSADYTRPETRRITYASITPAVLAEGLEVPEEELRHAYDTDIAHFQTPERRLLDRIGFSTDDEAKAARARLDSGETDFDSLATARGLKPADIDQGSVTADQLSPEARALVFGANGPGIVGPVTTPLGPSLFRINGLEAAHTTSFDEARPALLQQRALADATRQIAEDTAHIEDLIAGGATIEEIASETVMQLGTVELNSETSGGVADDPAFRQAALGADQGIETDLIQLDGGGLATLRVDEVAPPEVIPLAEIRDRVAADWTADETAKALETLAKDYITELKAGLAFPALAQRLDRPIRAAGPLTRGETADGTPAGIVADIFATPQGAPVTRRDGDGVILATVTAILPFDPAAPDSAPVLDQLKAQYRQQAQQDVIATYTGALRETAGVQVNQALVDSTLARFR